MASVRIEGSVDLDVSNAMLTGSGVYSKRPISGFYQAHQKIGTCRIPVAVRKYGLGQCVERYARFLMSLGDNDQVLKPSYVLKKGNEKVLVFTQRLDCTLATYIDRTDVFTKDDRFQMDFKDDIICICRQLFTGIEKCHTLKRRCGALTLESIYLDLGGPVPRVYFLPPYYEKQVVANVLLFDGGIVGAQKRHLNFQDWVSCGRLLMAIIDSKSVPEDSTKEIISLKNRMESGAVQCYNDFSEDPALFYEDRKMNFLYDAFERVFKVYRNDFLAPSFCEPDFLKIMSWRKKFETILVNIEDVYRCCYNFAEEPDGFLNLTTFVRSNPQHIGSNKYLKNNFRNGPTFVRYVRDAYPKLFEVLISVVKRYCERDGQLNDLLVKLKADLV